MTRILIIRHGHVEGLEPPRFRGRHELSLTELGRREAAATAAHLAASAKVAAVWTSPAKRCLETGQAIAEAAGVPARTIEALNDLDYGDWTWMTDEAARAANPDLYDRWRSAPASVRFPRGESLQDLALRAGDAWRLATAEDVDEGRVLVLVTHDSIIRAMLVQVLEQPLSAYRRLAISPCGISEIETDGAHTQVLGVNATGHLARL